jgi:hypothetical protein
MRRVLAAAFAELLELKTTGGRLLVLGRRVVPLFAVTALKSNNVSHIKPFPRRSKISNLKFQIY